MSDGGWEDGATMDRPTPLTTGRPVLWLHVGPMKTGTTYLQQLLFADRDALGRAGLHLPGEEWSR